MFSVVSAAMNSAVTVTAGTIVHRISSGLLPCVCLGSSLSSLRRRKRNEISSSSPSTRMKTMTAMMKVIR